MTGRGHEQDLKSKRILVTGGAGFLGSHIVERLRQIGCSQIAVPRRKDCDLTREDDIAKGCFASFIPNWWFTRPLWSAASARIGTTPDDSSTRTP